MKNIKYKYLITYNKRIKSNNNLGFGQCMFC
jgi:hypothetical protein